MPKELPSPLRSPYECSETGCTAHPAKGDVIFRISKKGEPFVGLCQYHYALNDGEVLDAKP